MRDLYKIMSGIIYLRFSKADLFVSAPSIRDKYAAEVFADEMYDQAFTEGCYTQEEMEELLLDYGWWSTQEQELLDQLPKNMEQMKVDYYNNINNEEMRKKVRSHLEKTEDRIDDLVRKKHLYYEHTCEGIRSSSVSDFLIRRTTFHRSGESFEFDSLSPRAIVLSVAKETLTAKQIREISRSPEWRIIWGGCKDPSKLFGTTTELTMMQSTLMSYSRMYDNAYESMETPPESIIEDDLALDGWFIVQRRKREDEQKQSYADKLSSKLRDAGEIMLPAYTDDDFQRIHDMNTGEAKGKVKSRFADLEQRGSLEEQNFAMVRQDLAIRANREAAAALKGR